MFSTNDGNEKTTDLILVVGNHDVGFHYDMNDRKLQRFNKSFSTTFVNLFPSKKRNDVYFVLLNSMALENDGCKFCKRTQSQLKYLNKTLECIKSTSDKSDETVDDSVCAGVRQLYPNRFYSRPIVLTHFPLFRKSDSICPDDIDNEYNNIQKSPLFKPKFDCLSLESTKQVMCF